MGGINNSSNQYEVNSSVNIHGSTPFVTVLGSGTLPSVTGVDNTAVGYQAGNALVSGSDCTFIGYQCGNNATACPKNTAVGSQALQGVLTLADIDNTAVGFQALKTAQAANCTAVGALSCSAVTTGAANNGFGASSLANCSTGGNNVAIGGNSLIALTTGSNNVALGQSAGDSLLTGSNNVLVGKKVGINYVGAESSNIIITNNGVAAESNVIRIGTTGSGTGQQNQCYIAGIENSTATNPVVVVSSSGQLQAATGIITAPVSSSTATTAFGTSLTAGTAVQNTTGYDILLNIALLASAASSATIVLGVGTTSTPTTNTVAQSFSQTVLMSYPPITFSSIVPNNYYVLVNTTGTITVASINVQACPL